MPRFFIEPTSSDTITISGSDAQHITKSLRFAKGDSLVVCDQQGYDYQCVIESTDNKQVYLKVVKKLKNITEPKHKVTLYQAMPKGNKLDNIIQKSVELGVNNIVPIITTYCVSRPKKDDMQRKLPRLQTISLEAAKQSDRGIVPKVEDMITFEQAIDQMKGFGASILCYEHADIKLSEHLSNIDPTDCAVMIGSEGGFSVEEVRYAQENGIKIASLGNRILRTETAPICVLSAIMFNNGEF